MKARIPFKCLRLWWPALQVSVPINAYGFRGKERGTFKASGPDYDFYVHPEFDCWVTEEGLKIPVSEASLEISPNPPSSVQQLRDLHTISFALVDANRVQINTYVEMSGGYQIEMIHPDKLFIVGDAFEDDE